MSAKPTRGRPKKGPEEVGVQFGVTLSTGTLAAMDRWIDSQPVETTRAAFIRAATEEFLKKHDKKKR